MPYMRKTRRFKNDDILERANGFHRFQKKIISASILDTRDFGMRLLSIRKHRARKIKQKRRG